jgi:hypothetical protein
LHLGWPDFAPAEKELREDGVTPLTPAQWEEIGFYVSAFGEAMRTHDYFRVRGISSPGQPKTLNDRLAEFVRARKRDGRWGTDFLLALYYSLDAFPPPSIPATNEKSFRTLINYYWGYASSCGFFSNVDVLTKQGDTQESFHKHTVAHSRLARRMLKRLRAGIVENPHTFCAHALP